MHTIADLSFRDDEALMIYARYDLGELLERMKGWDGYYAALEDAVIALSNVESEDGRGCILPYDSYPFIKELPSLIDGPHSRLTMVQMDVTKSRLPFEDHPYVSTFHSHRKRPDEKEVKVVYETTDGKYIMIRMRYGNGEKADAVRAASIAQVKRRRHHDILYLWEYAWYEK